MLIRVRGGQEGIADYLIRGQKHHRDYSRGELDQRVILDGDLTLTDKIIANMDKEGERYLHVTLAFKEDDIDQETMRGLVSDFKTFAMSAFEAGEYNFYAEAHLPKMKSYTHQKTGELVERKPHIHIVIPEKNLLSGHNLNPFGLVAQQTQFLEAFQEHANAKYGLASPKDYRRIEFTDESEMISRYKGDMFPGQNRDFRESLLTTLLTREVSRYEDFEILVSEYGQVRTRNKGKDGAYLNVKPPGAEKGINLKDYVFSREFIEKTIAEKRSFLADQGRAQYLTAAGPRPTDSELTDRLSEWHEFRAREIKYLNSGDRKLYTAYKQATRDERKDILSEREKRFYERYRDVADSDFRARENPQPTTNNPEKTVDGRERRIRADARRVPADRTRIWRAAAALHQSPDRRAAGGEQAQSLARVRNLSMVPLVHHQRGPQMLLPNHAPDRLGRQRTPDLDLRRPRAGGIGPATDRRITPARAEHNPNSAAGQRISDQQARQDGQAAGLPEFSRIKRELDARRLLTRLNRSHGVLTEKYEVTKGADGGDRIRAGRRNLNVSDFLTHELRLPWREAAPILRQTFAEQQGQEPAREPRRAPRRDLWADYRRDWPPEFQRRREADWRRQRESEQTRRAALRKAYQSQRRALQNDRRRPAAERKAALSVARMTKVAQDMALRAEVQAERQALKQRYRVPVADQYRAYLAERAQRGDLEALDELRRQRSKPRKPQGGQIEHAEGKAGVHVPPPKPAYTVDRQGNVTYFDDKQRALFTDTGRSVDFAQTDRKALEQGLRLAVAKFGPKLKLNGSEDYKRQIADLAADTGLRVTFEDRATQERYEQRIEHARIGRAYIAQAAARQTPQHQPQPDPTQEKTQAAPDKQPEKHVDLPEHKQAEPDRGPTR